MSDYFNKRPIWNFPYYAHTLDTQLNDDAVVSDYDILMRYYEIAKSIETVNEHTRDVLSVLRHDGRIYKVIMPRFFACMQANTALLERVRDAFYHIECITRVLSVGCVQTAAIRLSISSRMLAVLPQIRNDSTSAGPYSIEGSDIALGVLIPLTQQHIGVLVLFHAEVYIDEVMPIPGVADIIKNMIFNAYFEYTLPYTQIPSTASSSSSSSSRSTT